MLIKGKGLLLISYATAILVAAGLSILAIIDFIKHGYTLTTPGATVLILVAILTIIILPSNFLSNKFSAFEFAGVKVQTRINEVKREVETLKGQINALAHTALLEQVNSLNRLAIEKPEVVRHLWKGLSDLSEEEISRVFYVFAFLDAFDMLKLFREGKPLGDDLFDRWCKVWIPELLDSETGKVMKEKELLRFYSKSLIDLLSIKE